MKNNLSVCTDDTCTGLVLKETLRGEGDKMITVLTAKYGVIDILAKGVKNPKSKNAYAVQPFCYSEFELITRNYMYLLKTATIKDTHYYVRNDVEKFALASYFAEVALTVCTENNDETEMLRLMLNSFYALSKMDAVPLWKIKAAFEINCMVISGFMPELVRCGTCDKELADCKTKSGSYIFSLSDGTVLCPECASSYDVTYNFEISEGVLAAISKIVNEPQSKMLSYSISDEDIEVFALLCERFLVYHTCKHYKTLDFYKSLN